LFNHSRIRLWNKPVLDSEGNVHELILRWKMHVNGQYESTECANIKLFLYFSFM